MSALRDVVEVVARALADHPDQVSVTETEHRQTTLVELYMAPGVLGRVIGRQGVTINAIRSLLTAGSAKKDLRCTVDIVEDRPAP